MAPARLPIAAASGGLVEETRLDGDLAQRVRRAFSQVGVVQGAGVAETQ